MKKLYLICNAHIDPVWLWTLDEGKAAALSTFNSALKLLNTNDYIFCHNESYLYEVIKKNAPATYEKIKEKVRLGKWKIAGGWYIQPDCTLPSGETFVRLIRRGQQFFQKEFGATPKTALNLDAFGHSVGLVQILAKTGYDSCIVCRPHFDFWPAKKDWIIWKGLDGSQIKVARDKFHYSSEMGKAAEKIANTVAYYDEIGKEVGLSLWGVGNHGGGPSAKDLADIKRLRETSPVEIIHSFPEEAMANVQFDEEYAQSLITVFPGCYTSVREHKEKFALATQKLIYAEKICTVASLCYGLEYPAESIAKAQDKLLLNTFHDILAGTASEKGMKQSIDSLCGAISDLDEVITNAYLQMATQLTPSAEGCMPIEVFNPHPYPLKTIVEGEFMLPKIFFDKKICRLTVTDSNGKEVLSQSIKESSNFNVHWQKRVAFACELPPFAIEKYDVRFALVDDEEQFAPLPDTEKISFHVYDDNEDPWAQKKEQYVQMGENPVEIELIHKRIIENGALFTVYEKEYAYNRSRITLNEKHYRHVDKVDLSLRVYWQEENKLLKMHVQSGVGEYIGQIPFGTDRLYQDGRECSAQYFTGVRRGDKVSAVINNGVYGSSYKDGIIMVSLLRSGCFAAHPATEEETGYVRPLVDKNRHVPHFDQTLLQYEFRLAELAESELDRESNEFNQPPYAVNVFPCGAQSEIRPNIAIDNTLITLTALKKAEETDGYVIRLLNNTPQTQTAKISVCGVSKTYVFTPYEVRTFVYDGVEIYKTEQLIV